tara:strand:+ start:21010 stop:21519 length:510 start_codon:yes stop_codon:yes gene_type:complete
MSVFKNLIGSKYNYDLYRHLIEDNIPSDLNDRVYIEPFGGSFGLFKILTKTYSPKQVIYNDIKVYDFDTISLANITHNLDYTKIFEKYNFEDSFFYLDPPYIDKEHYYENIFTDHDHYVLSEEIKKLKGKWLLSYQDHPILRELYQDYCFDRYIGKSIYHQKEIIIKNY